VAPSPLGRQPWIDWLRGLAVLLMIQTHVYDAWVHTGDKATTAYLVTRHIGGVPARLFLFLVGVSMALRFEAGLRRGRDAAAMSRDIVRRGFGVLLLAYAFRVQEFILGGGWSESWLQIAKVDVLNCIGLTMMLLGPWCAPRGGRPAYARALAALLVFFALGPIVGPVGFGRSWPAWTRVFTSYVGGERPLAWFPVFPWLGWAAAGLVAGHVWLRLPERAPEKAARVFAATAALGAALMALVMAGRAAFPDLIRYPNAWVAAMGPGALVFRLGVVLLIAAAAWFWTRLRDRHGPPRFSPLELLGRTSLFVYWVHVELTYGQLSKAFHGHLTFRQASWGLAGMTALMLGLAYLRTRRFDPWWRARRAAHTELAGPRVAA